MAQLGQHQTQMQQLIHEMGLSEQDIERRKRIVGLVPLDLERIGKIKDLVTEHVDQLANSFFDYLAALEEGRALTAGGVRLERARELKRDHLLAMVRGNYDAEYAAQRLELALLYSRCNLDLRYLNFY